MNYDIEKKVLPNPFNPENCINKKKSSAKLINFTQVIRNEKISE